MAPNVQCRCGGRLKGIKGTSIYYHYYNERDGFINALLTTVIHVSSNHKKKKIRRSEGTSSAADKNKIISKS